MRHYNLGSLFQTEIVTMRHIKDMDLKDTWRERGENKCIFFSFFLFNLICAFLGHTSIVLTLDENTPLMEDTCWKGEFWIMFSKLSKAWRASIDFENDWARPRTAEPLPFLPVPQSTTRDLGHCAASTRPWAGIVSKNQKVIYQPQSHWSKYVVAKDTFYLLTGSNSMSYKEN